MRATRWAAVIIVIFGIAYLWGGLQIRQPTTYAAVGPGFFPAAIGIGILLSGIWLFLAPGGEPDPDSPQRLELDWPRLGGMLALVIAYIAAFKPAGYILSTALLMTAGAQLLGYRHHLLRDVVVGAALAIVVSLLFTRLLGINLPDGIIGW